MYNLSICAIVRNEGPYIDEWIQFHKLQGFEHFFLYENGSTDNTLERMKKYDCVTIIDYPRNNPQVDAYNDCIKSFSNTSKYMAFIDVDEFMYSVDENVPLLEILDSLLKDNAVALGVSWRVFGSSGYKEKPKGLVIENFTKRTNNMSEISTTFGVRLADNSTIKTICKPNKVVNISHPHVFNYNKGDIMVDENGKEFYCPFNPNTTTNKIALNHYVTKSKEEFFKRKQEGINLFPMFNYEIEESWNKYEKVLNEVEDRTLLKYVDKLHID